MVSDYFLEKEKQSREQAKSETVEILLPVLNY